MNIQISVIVPIYNGERTISTCLNSVINQTFKDIEIICIDDGSTDNTYEILRAFEKRDTRIRIIKTRNQGYGHAVNLGMDHAKGKYIAIVESDDYIAKDMYWILHGLAEKNKAEITKSNFYNHYVNESTEQVDDYINDERNNVLVFDRAFHIEENPELLWGHPSVWSALYLKSFLDDKKIRMIEDQQGGWEDNLFFFETMFLASKIVYTNEALYYYWKNNPESSSNKVRKYDLPLVRMNQNLDIMEKFDCSEHIKVRVYARALMYARGMIDSPEYLLHKVEILGGIQKLFARLDEQIFRKYFNEYDQKTFYKYSSPVLYHNEKQYKTKILIYNWLPYDNPWGWGGGVTVYCKNIIEEILKTVPTTEIFFISSGFAYSADSDKTYVRRCGTLFADRVKQFEIVNSPVPAEQRWLYKNPLVALENNSLKNVFKTFVEENGPFNAIHFNNIEGLSMDVLDLKEDFPETKFIFSIHNYVPICVNGSYYMRHKHCNCNPNHTGEDCYACTRADIRSNFSVEQYKRGLYGIPREECLSQGTWIKKFGFERLDLDVSKEDILLFEKTAKEKINKNCDSILAVSKRVYDIAKDNGIRSDKMHVSYIGTKIAKRQIGKASTEPSEILRVVFLGNDINYEEKGYPFLLETLSKMPERYASRIELVLTCKQAEHAEIYTMLKAYKNVKVINGYTHDDLPSIFNGAHLSIVPVMWEDNLPQIAIESVAFGVPVLASSAGGASELSGSNLFRYECGNQEELLKRIMHFLDVPEDLLDYWKSHNGLVTMQMHIDELFGYYGISNIKDEVLITLTYSEWECLEKEIEYLRLLSHPDANSHNTNLFIEDLKRKLLFAEEENRMRNIEGKIIFQNEIVESENKGANLFKLVLPDFNYSDFYAEIHFVKLTNFGISSSSKLRISGTWHEVTEDSYVLDLHQMEWMEPNCELVNEIGVFVRNNEVYFYGKYVGVASGYFYEIHTLTSRAENDNIRYECLRNGIIGDYDLQPEDLSFATNTYRENNIKKGYLNRLFNK